MTSKRLPGSVATILAIIGATCLSSLVGAGIGFLVTAVWFSNTRSDGVAAFLIAAIASGLFASVVTFTLIVRRHHMPSHYTLLFPALLWMIPAIQMTRMTCRGSFITMQNVIWILKSGDQRNFELGWLIRGWLAILVSLVAALSISRLLLRVRERKILITSALTNDR